MPNIERSLDAVVVGVKGARRKIREAQRVIDETLDVLDIEREAHTWDVLHNAQHELDGVMSRLYDVEKRLDGSA